MSCGKLKSCNVTRHKDIELSIRDENVHYIAVSSVGNVRLNTPVHLIGTIFRTISNIFFVLLVCPARSRLFTANALHNYQPIYFILSYEEIGLLWRPAVRSAQRHYEAVVRTAQNQLRRSASSRAIANARFRFTSGDRGSASHAERHSIGRWRQPDVADVHGGLTTNDFTEPLVPHDQLRRLTVIRHHLKSITRNLRKKTGHITSHELV